jgi:hypothetical protein
VHGGALPELEEELEGEFEGEEFLGGLARRAAQAVMGSLGGQPDGEFETELEGEEEGEEFLSALGGIARGLLGEGESEDEGEFEEEGEYELEGEWEGEFEEESEGMANPLRRVYPDAMMEHLGHAAAEAETEAEAEAFVGALVPLAAGLARSAAPMVARHTPHLVRGLSTVTRMMRRDPTTRRLVRVIPAIAARTTRSLARQAAHGRPITPRRAVRTLAGQTVTVLSNPRLRRRVIRRARALDRTYHRAARTGQWWTEVVPGASSVTGVRPPAPRGYAPYRTAGYAPYRTAGYAPYRTRGYQTYGARAQGVPVPRRGVRGRGYPRRRGYPPALSVAWVPVPAWRGAYPPPRTYPY